MRDGTTRCVGIFGIHLACSLANTLRTSGWPLRAEQPSVERARTRRTPVVEGPAREGDCHGDPRRVPALLYRGLGGQQPVPGYVSQATTTSPGLQTLNISKQVLAGRTPNTAPLLSPTRNTRMTWRATRWTVTMPP